MPKETFFDPRKPFESKRPETHEEWQVRMGGEVLAVVRSGPPMAASSATSPAPCCGSISRIRSISTGCIFIRYSTAYSDISG